MRLALFGGTFDPIHRGHLAIARGAAAEFELDSVLFAPTGRQPLKTAAPGALFEDRLAMARLAVGAEREVPAGSEFAVSERDAPRPDGSPNYTIELVRELARESPDARLFLLTGADSFLSLRAWREPEELLRLAEWVVVSRPGASLCEEDLAALGLTRGERGRVHLLTTVHQDVSATELRRRLGEGDLCLDWLPAEVAEYIAGHGLYREHGG